MLGAIAGDIIGSVYESRANRRTPPDWPLFHPQCRFTDDTVLTVAVAEHILTGEPLAPLFKRYWLRYDVGYGPMFNAWARGTSHDPYGSLGNGSAMRVSPFGWTFDDLGPTIGAARKSAEVTHNHRSGIEGAQAVAGAIFLARTGKTKEEIAEWVTHWAGYDLSTPLDEIRSSYTFDPTCPGSVPQAIRAFLESTDFESAVRLAVSLGGDADTQACIAGAIAEAFYGGVPQTIADEAAAHLDVPLLSVVSAFCKRFPVPCAVAA